MTFYLSVGELLIIFIRMLYVVGRSYSSKSYFLGFKNILSSFIYLLLVYTPIIPSLSHYTNKVFIHSTFQICHNFLNSFSVNGLVLCSSTHSKDLIFTPNALMGAQSVNHHYAIIILFSFYNSEGFFWLLPNTALNKILFYWPHLCYLFCMND